MKKPIIAAMLFMAVLPAFADGLLTRTAHSPQYTRMLSRNASTGIDAVYSNPAGLTRLGEGLSVGLYGQYNPSTLTLKSGFYTLNRPECTVKSNLPLFPTLFAAYRIKNLAFSLGFTGMTGQGTLTGESGIPSLEIPATMLFNAVPQHAAESYHLSGYESEAYYSDRQSFYGYQAGVSYSPVSLVSLHAGLRVVSGTWHSNYVLSNIRFKSGESVATAANWLTSVRQEYLGQAVQFDNWATSLSGFSSSIQQLITAGAGSYTLAQVQNAGYITSSSRAQYEAALANLNYTPAQIAALNMNQIKKIYSDNSLIYKGMGKTSAQTAAVLHSMVAAASDKELLISRKGTGITPVFGLHLTPVNNLEIGIRYELKTGINLTNDTTIDDYGLFPDDSTDRIELPAMLSAGISYTVQDRLGIHLSFNTWFDKGADWGQNYRYLLCYPTIDTMHRVRDIDRNSFEIGLGFDTRIVENLSLSAGVLVSRPGVATGYQSDFSFATPSLTLGTGVRIGILTGLDLDAGFSYTFYEEAEVPFDAFFEINDYTDTYRRSSFRISAGLSYRLGK